MQINGRIYDQEGKYRLVDTNDLAAYFSYDSSSKTLKIGSQVMDYESFKSKKINELRFDTKQTN